MPDGRTASTPVERPTPVKRGQQNGSGFLVSPEAQEWLNRMPMDGSCLFCPDVVFTGSALEVVTAQHAHRLAAHPGLRSMSQFERKRAAKAKAA